MKFFKYLLLLFVLNTSCGSIRNTTSNANVINGQPLSTKQFLRKASKNKTKFKTFQAKAKLQFKLDNKLKSYGLTLRVLKNNSIWISSTAGVVRALITKDSIYYYNKLEKEYLVTDFKSSESLIGFKLTYQMLENLLFAQPFGNVITNDLDDSNKAYPYSFKWSLNSNKYSLAGNYHFNDNNFKLSSCSFIRLNLLDNESFFYEVRFKKFNKTRNQEFPTQIHFSQDSIQQISLEFKSISLNNKFKLPFKIPKNFKKIEIND